MKLALISIPCLTLLCALYLLTRPVDGNSVRMVEVSKYDAETARLEFLTACQKRNPLEKCVEAK